MFEIPIEFQTEAISVRYYLHSNIYMQNFIIRKCMKNNENSFRGYYDIVITKKDIKNEKIKKNLPKKASLFIPKR